MIRNYFRTAWRNLVKNKFYSFINISGLTVGLAVGILILLWVQDELSFDRFHHPGVVYLPTRKLGGYRKQSANLDINRCAHCRALPNEKLRR